MPWNSVSIIKVQVMWKPRCFTNITSNIILKHLFSKIFISNHPHIMVTLCFQKFKLLWGYTSTEE